MPVTEAVTGGFVNNTSFALPIPLPVIVGQMAVIQSISAMRTGGRLLTDGDQMVMAMSHQSDILSADLTDDEDDVLFDPHDYWWQHGLSETDHVSDHLDHPEEVAGPQTLVIFNGTGETVSVKVLVNWETRKGIPITPWTLLKTLTSYEGKD